MTNDEQLNHVGLSPTNSEAVRSCDWVAMLARWRENDARDEQMIERLEPGHMERAIIASRLFERADCRKDIEAEIGRASLATAKLSDSAGETV